MPPRQWLAQQRLSVAGPLRRAGLYGVVEGLLIIAQAGLIAWLVDQVIMSEQTLTALLTPALALVGVVVLRPVFQLLRVRTGINAASSVRGAVHARILTHAEALGPNELGALSRGELASQLTDQVEALDGYFARYLPQLIIATVVPLAIVTAAYTQDYIAASFFLLSAPLIPLFMALVGMGAERLNRDQFEALARLSGQFLDRVRGLSTLRLFGRIDDATQGIKTGSDEYRERSMRVLRVAFLSSAVLEFFASVAIAVVAIYVGFGLLGYIDFGPAPSLTLFSGLFVLLLAPEFFQPLRALAQHYHDRATAMGAAELLAEFESRPIPAPAPSRSDHAHTDHAADLTDAQLRAQAVVISRPNRGPILTVDTLNAKAGEIILIEGPSGSGKTSLLLALAGMLAPDSGNIQRHFQDTRIGWLGAPAFLSNASLRENIQLGYPEATPQAIEAAAYQAGVSEFAQRLSDGLDTHVGERGLGLSGGQAQRVALARAFCSPAPLILLDEPTAALDAETERWVITGIQSLASEGRCVVMASHDRVLRTIATRCYAITDGKLEVRSDA